MIPSREDKFVTYYNTMAHESNLNCFLYMVCFVSSRILQHAMFLLLTKHSILQGQTFQYDVNKCIERSEN